MKSPEPAASVWYERIYVFEIVRGMSGDHPAPDRRTSSTRSEMPTVQYPEEPKPLAGPPSQPPPPDAARGRHAEVRGLHVLPDGLPGELHPHRGRGVAGAALEGEAPEDLRDRPAALRLLRLLRGGLPRGRDPHGHRRGHDRGRRGARTSSSDSTSSCAERGASGRARRPARAEPGPGRAGGPSRHARGGRPQGYRAARERRPVAGLDGERRGEDEPDSLLDPGRGRRRIGAAVTITRRNPLASALALAVCLVALAGLFAGLSAPIPLHHPDPGLRRGGHRPDRLRHHAPEPGGGRSARP